MEVKSENTNGASVELERLAQEFAERRRRGERPEIEEYVFAYPALAAEIRELFSTLLILEDLGATWSTTVSTGAVPAETDTEAGIRGDPASPGLQQVGEYRILREIGRGGMGVVYEAEQASLGRRVALKVLPFHSLLDQKRLERFRQEARAAARLSHPNIVPVYGVGEHLGMNYYVMQLIPGQGLNRVIEEVRRLRERGEPDGDVADPSSSSSLASGLGSGGTRSSRERYFRNVARLARDAALALDYAHGEGILHRDVKPSNLLLDPSGRVWLTDFGLAKAEGSDELTKSGDVVGTILYMAPERFQGWSDPRSDVYCLGMTLHELLTLRPAFQERDRAQLLRKVAAEDPPPPRRLDRAIPRDLETVVLKAIAKEPAHRYGTARAMAQDLDRFLDGLPVEARRSHALARVSRWCGRNPLSAALALAVLVLLVVVAVSSFIHMGRLEEEHAAGQSKLRAADLAKASALRLSARAGRRFEALDALAEAAAIRAGPDLVDEAIACLALVDARTLKTWTKERPDTFAISPDGAILATGLPGGKVTVRSVKDDEASFDLPAPGFPVEYTWTKFSPDGKHLATRYHHYWNVRNEWRVWDLDRRRICATVTDGHPGNCGDFAPDGSWVVLGTKEQSLRIIDLVTGDTIVDGVARGAGVVHVAVHPGGRLLAYSSGITRKVHVLDLEGNRIIRSMGGLDERIAFNQLAWHPDGRTLVAANDDHHVYLWNVEAGDRSRILYGHRAEVVGTDFDPAGTLVASLGWDPALHFWDPASDRPVLSLQNRSAFGFLGGGHKFWTSNDYSAELWELAASPPAFTLFGHARMAGASAAAKHPHTVVIASGGRLAASGGDDGVRLWDLVARTEVGHLPGGTVRGLYFDPRGTGLFASGPQGLRHWPLRTIGDEEARIAVGPVQHIAESSGWKRADLGDGARKMLAAHGGNHAHLFDTADPEHWIELRGLPPDWYVALSADGVWAAAGSFHGDEVWVWDTRGAKRGVVLEPVRKLPARQGRVKFHPAGTHLATCSPKDCTLWRLADGEPAWRIERERNLTFSGAIAFAPDGETMAIAYDDSKVWLLETATGRKLCELEGPEPAKVTELDYDGNTVAASTGGRQINVWDLNALGRDITDLGLRWDVPCSGAPLANRPPVRVTIIEPSVDVLRDESHEDLASRALLRPVSDVAFRPRLSSCADIDRALTTPRFLIAEGERWRFSPGRDELPSGIDWTEIEFDDTAWREGRTPLSGWEPPYTPDGTFLAGQRGSYTSLYARRSFTIDDPVSISRLVLAVELEDGLVAFLNGEEIGRANAGERGARLSAKAMARRRDRSRTTEVFEIDPGILEPGKNVLAVQVLAYGLDSFIHFLPVLSAIEAPDDERDGRRTRNLLTDVDGTPEPSLRAYRNGRFLQRAARYADALEEFERAGKNDPTAAEPLLRRLACHAALGELTRAEALARDALKRGEILDEERLWRAWHRVALVDLGRTPAAVLADFPRGDPTATSGSVASTYRRLLESLAEEGAIRINCGGNEITSPDDKRWARDAFFLGGAPVEHDERSRAMPATSRQETESVESTERTFGGRENFRKGYSIPLATGRYRVSIHIVEKIHHVAGRRLFDVLAEDELVLESCDALRAGFSVPDVRSFELAVADGALDLDFVAHQNDPRIAAIEVEPVSD